MIGAKQFGSHFKPIQKKVKNPILEATSSKDKESRPIILKHPSASDFLTPQKSKEPAAPKKTEIKNPILNATSSSSLTKTPKNSSRSLLGAFVKQKAALDKTPTPAPEINFITKIQKLNVGEAEISSISAKVFDHIRNYLDNKAEKQPVDSSKKLKIELSL